MRLACHGLRVGWLKKGAINMAVNIAVSGVAFALAASPAAIGKGNSISTIGPLAVATYTVCGSCI